LKHLPTQVLRQQNYRLLIQLLDDPDSANVLHHASKIDDLAIAVLAESPQPLRRALRDHGQRGDLASHQHRGGYSRSGCARGCARRAAVASSSATER
jgi:hypothetical protein